MWCPGVKRIEKVQQAEEVMPWCGGAKYDEASDRQEDGKSVLF